MLFFPTWDSSNSRWNTDEIVNSVSFSWFGDFFELEIFCMGQICQTWKEKSTPELPVIWTNWGRSKNTWTRWGGELVKKCLVLSLFRVKIVHVEEGEVKNGPKNVLVVIEWPLSAHRSAFLRFRHKMAVFWPKGKYSGLFFKSVHTVIFSLFLLQPIMHFSIEVKIDKNWHSAVVSSSKFWLVVRLRRELSIYLSLIILFQMVHVDKCQTARWVHPWPKVFQNISTKKIEVWKLKCKKRLE